MRTALLLSVAVTMVAGCSPPPGFDRLGPFTLKLLHSTNASNQLLVEFAYDTQRLGCQELDPDLSVQLNGAEALSVLPGGAVSSTLPLFPQGCQMPMAEVRQQAAFADAATITATSGGDAVLMEVQDMGFQLDAQPILAPGEQVHVGQLVQIAIGPGFDRVQWSASASADVRRASGSVAFESISVPPPSTAGVIDLRLPDTLPWGTTSLWFGGASHPRVTRCEGAGACSGVDSMSVAFHVELEVVP